MDSCNSLFPYFLFASYLSFYFVYIATKNKHKTQNQIILLKFLNPSMASHCKQNIHRGLHSNMEVFLVHVHVALTCTVRASLLFSTPGHSLSTDEYLSGSFIPFRSQQECHHVRRGTLLTTLSKKVCSHTLCIPFLCFFCYIKIWNYLLMVYCLSVPVGN